MGWTFCEDLERYSAAVTGVLTAEPVRHTISLTVLEQLRGGHRWSADPIVLGWCTRESHVEAALSMTPPYRLLLAGVDPADVADLVKALRAQRMDIPGVNAERAVASVFADAWVEATGLRHEVEMEERLYRLGQLVDPPRRAHGHARVATADDLDLVAEWIGAFEVEAHTTTTSADQRAGSAARLIDAERCWLWFDGDHVAMAGRTPTVAGVARVGPVYTPPRHRGRGYGTEITAACTRDAVTQGADGVVLFTDLANPTSNAIYQAIGYRPVSDRLVIRFV